jgi:hypothetical protein
LHEREEQDDAGGNVEDNRGNVQTALRIEIFVPDIDPG